jgi:activator of 2-hydroxyglutaryl-CoA dehydratase
MNNVDIGIDFGITNSDIVINSNNNFSYKSLRSEKNIHLSLNNILKSIQEKSKVSL